MENGIVCFVILHYLNTEDTRECVDSILKLEDQNLVRIVIVDNDSPNGSGRLLSETYSDNERVHVLLMKSNAGFSRGNNAGAAFAKRKWDPDFYVVANNDVVFEQTDFVRRIRDLYLKYRFDVLGPDTYVPHYDVHQNPMQKDPPTLSQVQLTIIKNTILAIILPFYFKRVNRRHEEGRRAAADNYQIIARDVCLKGACTIYSRKYAMERDRLYAPETFFYYEEFIQAAYCRKMGKVVIYDPELKVIHKDGASIAGSNREMYDRCKYTLNVTRTSAKIYRNYLLRIKK